MTDRFWVVIPAGGSGQRFGTLKQHTMISDKSALAWVLDCFDSLDWVAGTVLVHHPDDVASEQLFNSYPGLLAAYGGDKRVDSVMQGLLALSEHAHDNDWVLVHDAARPALKVSDVNKLKNAISSDSVGGILAIPVRDTLKRVGDNDIVQETVSRLDLVQAQTPQMFRYGLLRDCINRAQEIGVDITDESSAVEACGYDVKVVPGSADNLKLTYPEDLLMIQSQIGAPFKMRIGQGFDLHRFGEGDYITLGGVKIAHTHGIVAHSDGDVIIHALCDAIYGALSLGDIGVHFPDTADENKGRASKEFLTHASACLKKAGLTIGNIDITVFAERPKISKHRVEIQAHLSELLCVSSDQISIKATTFERLGVIGREEAIAAQAIILIG